MPNINIDDAYILNETGAQVDKVTGLFTKNENATTGEKQMARLNIAAGGSNPNLLDNAYFVGGGSQLGDGIFPINQRGQTSYSAYTNSIDQWYAADAMTVAADGISCGAIVQKLPQVAPLDGKTLTFSALLADGTMLSGSAVFNSASDTYFYYDAGAVEHLLYNTYFGGFEVVTARKIAAVKLEYGTVSTLANDVRPDFGKVLEKCKRYLQRVKQPQGYTASVGFGMVGAASNILRTTIPLSSPLRNAASITATATNTGQMFVWGNGSYYSVTGVTGRTVLNGNAIVDITVNGTLENYKTYNLILNNADAYIDLSAPL